MLLIVDISPLQTATKQCGENYMTCVVFKNPVEADEAFDKINGNLTKVCFSMLFFLLLPKITNVMMTSAIYIMRSKGSTKPK